MNTPDRIILNKKWLPTINDYETAHNQHIIVAANLRRLDKVIADTRTKILEAMKEFYLAKCEKYIIVRTTGRIITPTLTLSSAKVIPLSDIATITLKDGTRIPGDQILKVFAGRNEGDKIAVTK